MKRVNFNIKDRKLLFGMLTIVLVSIFTLSIAYAALNTVLNISGNARVSAADWDIYFNNVKVTNGSATTNLPIIRTSNTLEFNTTLNLPGDFYEFTVDVVNDGSIDAMIENIVKEPELTAEQAKYLKYEISYANGDSIESKQVLSKGTSNTLIVRIEYRKDIISSDLPSGQVVLDLLISLDYIQYDNSSSGSGNNSNIQVAGSLDDIGTVVTIGRESFYTIGTEGNNVKLLSMYNLHVGNLGYYDGVFSESATPLENPTYRQDSTALGYIAGSNYRVGTVSFSSSTERVDNHSNYDGSVVERYVNDYKLVIETYNVSINEARLITYDELVDSNTFACDLSNHMCSDKYPFIYGTSYWTMSSVNLTDIYYIDSDNWFDGLYYNVDCFAGVRPVLVISRDQF